MKKIINDPSRFVDESIDGILLAHPQQLRKAGGNARAIVRQDAPRAGKVGIVTGGGSGHLPVFLGYVGVGLCDGVAVGNVFSSPSAEVIHAATTEVSGGAGVLYLYGNYGGDIYNFDLAADLAEIDGIPTRTVLAADDVASAPLDKRATRRGIAGMFYGFKIAGAAAERGYDLDRVAEIAQRTADGVRTMGVGLSPTILPAAGEPTFVLKDGEMEVGIGIHGEPGIHTGTLEGADSIADRLLGAVLDDLSLPAGTAVSILVNGMGATPLEELYVLYRRVNAILHDRGLVIRLPFVGNYVTSLEMAGASISVLRLDAELEELLDAPAYSPFFSNEPSADRNLGGEADPSTAVVESVAESTESPDEAGHETALSPLGSLLVDTFGRLPSRAEHLRELDAALGDGDLGITVTLGSEAIVDAIRHAGNIPDGPLLQKVGAAFASANPSTFAALLGGGILFAASRLGDRSLSDRASLVKFGTDVADRIVQRGGAQPGDKTVLDVILPSLATLDESDGLTPVDTLTRVINSVRSAIDASTPLRSARGRAAWLQERSIGQQDPGMTAYLGFLEELRAAVENTDAANGGAS
jgi:dihydroxyacetone kinase